MPHRVKHGSKRGPRSAASLPGPSRLRPATIRIVVADEQAIDREGLAALLDQQQDFSVVGQAASSQETVERCRALHPGLLVIDSRMPDLAGVPVIAAVRAAAPDTRILALADHGEGQCLVLSPPGRAAAPPLPDWRPCALGTDCLLLAVSRGALGAIRRSAPAGELYRAVRTVAAGTAWLEAGAASRLSGAMPAPGALHAVGALSVRDLEVAACIAEGRSNKEIARALEVGEPTVKRHVGRMLERLGLQDRLQLGLYVARHPQMLERPASPPPAAVTRDPRLRS
jgi:DNA-binding NarL/FixJ family response regulator